MLEKTNALDFIYFKELYLWSEKELNLYYQKLMNSLSQKERLDLKNE